MHMFTHTHTHTCAHTRTHACIYIFICIYGNFSCNKYNYADSIVLHLGEMHALHLGKSSILV